MADISITGLQLALALGGILVFVIGLVLFMKRKYAQGAQQGYSGQGANAGSPIVGRNKYPQANPFSLSGTFFNLGLALALGIVTLAFGWTQYEEEVYIPENALEIEDEIVQEPPRTAEPPPPPPPPPPPVIEEVPEEEIIEEEPEFVDQTVEEETIIEAPPVVEDAPPPPPPPPPPPEPKVEEIFRVVEQMPRFPGCENQGGTDKEKKACAERKLLEYIYKNIKYPAIARENGVEGNVVVQFVVDKDGSINKAKVVRDIGAGCGEEALRVVELMNTKGLKWTPGKQRGRAVKVQFNLPIKFRLE